jgi:hypothetical protein
VHVELARALAPVLHDLERTGGPIPRVDDEDWTDRDGMASANLWSPDGSGMGIWLTLADSRAQHIAHIADQVQEWAVGALWGNAPTNWPPCPKHPTTHPLQALVRDGAARWTCPKDGTAVAVVGTLG